MTILAMRSSVETDGRAAHMALARRPWATVCELDGGHSSGYSRSLLWRLNAFDTWAIARRPNECIFLPKFSWIDPAKLGSMWPQP